jgi:protein O-GlcNAc transferase
MNPASELQVALEHHQAGRLAEAERIYLRVLALQPDHVEALNMVGVLATQTGRFDMAVEVIQRAIALKPGFAEAHYNLGNAFQNMGRLDEAITVYRESIRLKPGLIAAYNNLANTLRQAERLDEAIATFRDVLRLKPDLAEAHSNLGNTLKDVGQLDEAFACYRRAIQLRPEYTDAHDNLVLALHYHPAYDTKMICDELRRWKQEHAAPLRKFIQPHTNNRDPDRRLRIGLVSPDFKDCVIAPSLLPLLTAYDRGQLEIFCYANVLQPDARTDQIRSHTDAWRDISRLSDSQAIQMIREDQIDILVDLALHTGNNRLLIFARKPAPVQVTYLGYCSSTGLDVMDYRLSDPFLDPRETDLSLYCERTIRLPLTYWCYSVAGPTRDPSPPPAASAGYVTFGCLNNYPKVSTAAQDLWAEILRIVPKSRLIIHSPPGTHLNGVRERFARRGVSSDRLEFTARQRWSNYMRTYDRFDIALDPFPWGGGITTCDALWMGVPVVSLVGRTAVGRGGESILTNIGLPELIARSPEEYVSIVANLAGDPQRLAELRRTLRPRMQASPLTDAPRFARDVESTFRWMWRQWCGKPDATGSQS